MGSSPWAAAPVRSLLLRGLCIGFSFFQGMATCSGMGSSMGCSRHSSPAPREPSPPTFSLTLMSARQFHIFLTPLSHSCCTTFFTLSWICYLGDVTSIVDGLSFGSYLELSGTGGEGQGEAPNLVSQMPPLQPSCCQNLATPVSHHNAACCGIYSLLNDLAQGLNFIVFTTMFCNFS